MDPVSIIGLIASVTSICATGAQLIGKVSSGVNGVLNAPKAVQELSNELAAVYLALGQIRVLVENPSRRTHHGFASWMKDFELVLVDCHKAFEAIGLVVNNAKKKTRKSGPGEVIKRVKWVWEEKDLPPLKARLEGCKATLMLMLEVLNW